MNLTEEETKRLEEFRAREDARELEEKRAKGMKKWNAFCARHNRAINRK